jgi:hypothetical protein
MSEGDARIAGTHAAVKGRRRRAFRGRRRDAAAGLTSDRSRLIALLDLDDSHGCRRDWRLRRDRGGGEQLRIEVDQRGDVDLLALRLTLEIRN